MKQGRDGYGGNQGAERLKKPESAAQSGEVGPMLVAPRFQSAEGKGTSGEQVLLPSGRKAARVGYYLQVGRKVKRGASIFCRGSTPGPVGKTSRCSRKEKHEEGVLNQWDTTGWSRKL
jgi:hypothetical protein